MRLKEISSYKLKPFLFGWLGFFLAFFSCRNEKEFLVNNQAPSVRIFVESIGLPDSARLFTQIKMSWSGQDADGYVKEFRVSWSANRQEALSLLPSAPLISRTDSTFLFNFSGNSDTASIYFYVQAIDDKGLASLEPAFLRIPVKNSKPSIRFLTDGLVLADTVWSVLSLPYTFSDPDGSGNIDSVYLRINSGEWVGLPKNLSFISVVPGNPSASGETNAFLYAGENLATLNKEPVPIPNLNVPGLRIGEKNRFFIRVKDLAGAISVDSTPMEYFFRRKTSDLLLVDAYKGEGAAIGDTLYGTLLSSFTGYDRIDMNAQGGINQPKFWNASFYLMCKLYGKVFWYSDILTNLPGQVPILLTTASSSLIQYLRFDGKLLASAIFPDAPNQLAQDDAVFSLLPIAKVSEQSNVIRLRRNDTIQAKKPGYQDLKSTNSIVTGVDIFETRPGVDTLYFMPKESLTSTYTGPPLPIALRTRNPFNNRTNLVFFGMELTNLSGDRQALSNTLNRILNEEFNW